MEYNEFDRDKQSNELKDFVECTDKYLNELLSSLGWSEQSIVDIHPSLICPFDSSHRLSEKKLEQHLEECQWKAEGYGELDIPLSIPSALSNSPYCISFDEQLYENVLQLAKLKYPSMKMGTGGRLIPRTSDRHFGEFSTEERKILYDYAVANTVQPDIGEDITDLNKPLKSNESKTSSYLELLAQERNLKRRRTKHRGIHTNKKSHIEIFREVINQQMEILAEYIAEKNDYVKTENTYCSSRTSHEFEVKDSSNSEKRNSIDRYNHNFIDVHDYNNRSRRSTDIYNRSEKKHASKKSHQEVSHSKHSRKSSKERNHHRSREREDREEKKIHKRHHSKHRHRDKMKHRSRDSESSRHSKKSKYNDKKK